MTRRRPLIALVAFLLAFPALGAQSVEDGLVSIETLQREIDAILSTGSYRRADWGVQVVSLERDEILYDREGERPLSPASNMKILTSVAALHHLGPDWRFLTWALTEGEVRDGILEGDLILYGTGDPGLADRWYLDRGEPWRILAAQLREAGITRIRGRVIGDGTFFSGPLTLDDDWEPDDLNEWYAAPSGALSYNENVTSVRIEASLPGAPPTISTLPDHTGLRVQNLALTVARGPAQRISLLRDDPLTPIVVDGEIRVGAPDVWRQMTITDPALFAAHGMTHVLRDEGIAVDGAPGTIDRLGDSPLGGRLADPEGRWRVLAELRSPPLSSYLTAVNQRSHNLYADLILKTLGRALEGQGSWNSGRRAVERFAVDELGVDPGEVRVIDGSGLAATNRLSPRTLIAALEHAEEEGYAEDFRASLAEAGSRSLRRMTRTAAQGNLRAKTGTISEVSALSGFVTTRDGERLAFSIIGNSLPSERGAKRLEDRIGSLLADWRREGND